MPNSFNSDAFADAWSVSDSEQQAVEDDDSDTTVDNPDGGGSSTPTAGELVDDVTGGSIGEDIAETASTDRETTEDDKEINEQTGRDRPQKKSTSGSGGQKSSGQPSQSTQSRSSQRSSRTPQIGSALSRRSRQQVDEDQVISSDDVASGASDLIESVRSGTIGDEIAATTVAASQQPTPDEDNVISNDDVSRDAGDLVDAVQSGTIGDEIAATTIAASRATQDEDEVISSDDVATDSSDLVESVQSGTVGDELAATTVAASRPGVGVPLSGSVSRQAPGQRNPNDPNEQFGDFNFDIKELPSYRDPEEVLEERAGIVSENLDFLSSTATAPIAAGERALTGETGGFTQNTRRFTRSAFGLLNIPQSLLSGLEATEFAAEGTQETISGDGREFAERTEAAASRGIQTFATQAQERPLYTAAGVAGSLVGSSIILGKIPSTRAIIQPGEELASGTLTRAFPKTASRFPGGRIDNEEIVIAGARRAAGAATNRAGFAVDLARGEAELPATPRQQDLVDRFRPGAGGDMISLEGSTAVESEIDRVNMASGGARSEPLGSETEGILDATSQMEDPGDRAIRTLPERRRAALESASDAPGRAEATTGTTEQRDLPLFDEIQEFGGVRSFFRDKEVQRTGPISTSDIQDEFQNFIRDDRGQATPGSLFAVEQEQQQPDRPEDFRDFSGVEDEIERRTRAQRRSLEGDFEGTERPFVPEAELERRRASMEPESTMEEETGRPRPAEAVPPLSDSVIDTVPGQTYRTDLQSYIFQDLDADVDTEQGLESELESELTTEAEQESELEQFIEFESETETETETETELEREGEGNDKRRDAFLFGPETPASTAEDKLLFGVDTVGELAFGSATGGTKKERGKSEVDQFLMG